MLAYFKNASLSKILLFGLIVRLIAAIFSEGYGMHDDHFLIIESSASWVDGFDYNAWLPWTKGNNGIPSGHSFTYVGLNYLFFSFFDWIGLDNPKTLMLINRLIHAFFSLSVVYFGFKITEKLANISIARTVAWLLALLWMLPFMSVRNLVELVPISFLMWAIWIILNSPSKIKFIYAGLLIGFAVSIRYQIATFAFGLGLVYLIRLEWKNLLLYVIGFVLIFGLTQGVVDYFIWGYPFAEFLGYSVYNMNEGTQYLKNQNYLMYVLVLSGVMLFPFGLLMLIGYFNSFKKYLLLFLPSFCFLLFHTIYPNRQERFILTILPFFIILGVLGFNSIREKKLWDKTWNFSYRFFWILNIPLLLFLSFTSSKISRVNAMYSLYGNDIKDEQILIEASGEANPEMMPKFYAKSWNCQVIERNDTTLSLKVDDTKNYDYLFFFGEDDLKKRIKPYYQFYPKMKVHAKCESTFMDRTLNWINPRNSNQYIEVWKTNYSN